MAVENGYEGVAVKPEPAWQLPLELGAAAGYFENAPPVETVQSIVDEKQSALGGREVAAVETGGRAQSVRPGVALSTEERSHRGQPPLWGAPGAGFKRDSFRFTCLPLALALARWPGPQYILR
jgi:hypothetical protein